MVRIDDDLCLHLLQQAEQNRRRRSHHNFHPDHNDAVQRLAIGLLKGSYVRPHLHPQPYKWELLQIVRGSVALFIFDDDGCVKERIELRPAGATYGVELAPQTLHTILPVSDEAVIFELKQGPYTPAEPGDFAPWAPEEGSAEVEIFLQWLEGAQEGERYNCKEDLSS